MYLAVQETSRFNGKFSLNSLKFPRVYNAKTAPFMIRNVKVTLKGQEIEGLACNDATHSFCDHYFRLCHLTNQDHGKNAFSISYKTFTESACFLVYDFTSTLNETEPPLLPLVKQGHIRVEIDFDKPSNCSLSLISMLELQSVLTIEGNGKCTISSV